ncbi:MAG: RNA polymerase factor sigma-54 [Planctomycetota bacterium]|jgi:RNA polymerase sigma-54 factor
MRLELGLAQKLGLQLKLAPQIIQSIEILQLPALSLQELVETELQENEALEREEEYQPEAERAAAVESENGQLTAEQQERDAVSDTLERLEQLENAADRDWQDFGKRGGMGGGGDDDAKHEAMNNTADAGASLHDTLYDQFVLLDPTETQRTIGRHIIYNLNENGLLGRRKEDGSKKLVYQPYALEEILDSVELRGRFTLEDAEDALRMVQRLEPKGVGARDHAEALLLQLDPEDPDYEYKSAIVREHLEDIRKNKRPKVARDLGITIPQLNRLVDEIATLHPFPAGRMRGDRNAYVQPDVLVEWRDGRWEIVLEDHFFPRIRVSPHYRDMLRNSDDPKVKDYVRKKLESAKWLVDAIQQRQNTLYRVCEEIFKVQREYLDYGRSHLKPLKMQEIADRVGIHVSTVSRAIADKWAQTPRGIVPLKFFFTGGAETADGETMSRFSVKEKVRDIIGKEDKRSPLSDEQVAETLKKEGLEIARRTVTKYRKALQIPSSRQRRQWD